MPHSDPLVLYGLAVIVIVGGFIIVPILRGSREILTAWNTLLFGILVFTGIGSIEVKYVTSLPFEQLNWFQPTAKEVHWYMWMTTAFIVALLASYYWYTPAKTFAQKRFRKWPELSAPLVFFVIGCCFGMIAISMFCMGMVFFGPLTFNLALIGAPAGCVFSFALWYRNRLNVGWLLIFLGVMIGTILWAMMVSGGRRPLLSIFLGPFLYVYGMQVHKWSRAKLFLVVGIATVFVFSVGVVYSKFRWYSTVTGERRTVTGVLDQMSAVRAKGNLFSVLGREGLSYFGQMNALFAMLTERYVTQGVLDPVPLNSLRYLATYPIPRKVWPKKPEMIGITVVRDVSHIRGTNWGLGVAGQGAFEGGAAALALYAFLLAIGVRVLDEPMRLQPGNAFLVSMHTMVLPHVVAIPRGDMAAMVQQVAQGVLFIFLLGVVCRAIFGSKSSTPAPATTTVPFQNARYNVVPGSPASY